MSFISGDTDVSNSQPGVTVCTDSIDLMKGSTAPQVNNAEISSCGVMGKVTQEEKKNNSEMNPLSYSRCCRNTRIKLYFSVSGNVYVQ